MSEMRWQDGPRDKTLASPSTYTRPNDTLQGWKKEIAAYYQTMFNFINMDSIEVFQQLSQFSARASEMRSRIPANAARDENNFRIKIIDPFIEECDRQFKLHSRIQAIMEMEARMSGGPRA